MATNRTQGTTPFATAIDAELLEAFKAFVGGRPESIRWHVEVALRRHMANPPGLPATPPLPPLPGGAGPAAEPESTGKRPAKPKGKK